MTIGNCIARCLCHLGKKLKNNGGFGMNELLGIAAALILAAFIIIPELKNFSTAVMGELDNWWSDYILDAIFPNSVS